MGFALALFLPTSAGCVAADDELVEVLHARLGQPKLDLLLVIKSSACGLDDQDDIRENIHRLTESFATYEGGAPDLHIGVTTADLGVDGDFGIMTCDVLGDDGALVVPASQELENCSLQGDANFLAADLADPSEPGAQNFAGTLDESLACMIMVRDRGCGFRRPLSAMRRALAPSQPSNGGFLRDDADLAVVIVSDGDDCSASDTGLYDPAAESLGRLSSFRCFAHGVECDQEDLNELGVKTNCRARSSSPYFDDIDVFADFLKDLKGPAQRVSVAVMAGTYGGSADTVEVIDAYEGQPDVNGSCRREDGFGYSQPGVRLNSFVGAMGQAGRYFSLCSDIGETLTSVGEFFRQRSSERCIRSPLADTDNDKAGLQPHCEVRLLGLDREPELVPSCAAVSGDERCWTVEAAPTECGQITADGIELMLHGSEPVDDSLVLVARCKVGKEAPVSLARELESQPRPSVAEPYMCPVEEF